MGGKCRGPRLAILILGSSRKLRSILAARVAIFLCSRHSLAIRNIDPASGKSDFDLWRNPGRARALTTSRNASEGILQTVLTNYLISQARTVEGSINRALWALLERNERLASEVFLTEPRINEMEMIIDEHSIRMLRQGNLLDTDVRLIVASLKINNDLERMGDLAVNLSERAISLSSMGPVATPPELEPMITAVRAMVSKCLGALIYQNVDLATQVLESDDLVDQYRDQVFEALLAAMTADPSLAAPNMHFVLASRHLERIADHATNIAEDVLFWVRGLEVRHGRALQIDERENAQAAGGM